MKLPICGNKSSGNAKNRKVIMQRINKKIKVINNKKTKLAK